MDKQMRISQEFIEKANQCAQGDLSAMEWMYLHFKAELSEDFLINEEKFFSAFPEKEAVEAMKKYLLNKPEEYLNAEAMGFWLNRAAFYGDRSADEYLEAHAFFKVCCYFAQDFYSGNKQAYKHCSGDRLRQLGILTVNEETEFSMKSLDRYRIFRAENDGGYEGPDDDGFGMEELYNFFFYDEFFNPLLQLSKWSYRDLNYAYEDLKNDWESSKLIECFAKKAEYQKQRDDFWQSANETSRKYQIPYGCKIENGVVTGYISSADESEIVIIPEGVKEIAYRAFKDCESISSITMPNSIETIGPGAFMGCGLTSFIWPVQVSEIPKAAFLHCHNLKSIIIPEGVKKIGDWAFMGCWELEDIYIPDSVEEIDEEVFRYCSNLKSIRWPKNVHGIPKSCFYGCKSLVKVDLPEEVTVIGEDSFAVCHSIKELTLPPSIQIVGKRAFHYCKYLEIVIWSENAPFIDENTFDECQNLKCVVVPSIGIEIHPNAFSNCGQVTIEKY